MSDKNSFRQTVRKKFKKLSSFDRIQRSQALVTQLLTHPKFGKAKTVMAFLPLDDEVDISFIFSGEKKFVVPKIKEGKIVPVVYTEETPCKKGQYGNLEPIAGKEVNEKKIDLIIVPGFAFTLSGKRIGRGKGYYDRFLASLPKKIPKISLAFKFQIFNDLPFDKSDVKVDLVITEQEEQFSCEYCPDCLWGCQ